MQRNAQGISPLRQYLCHHAARISEATSVFLQFSGVETEIELISARSGIFVRPVNLASDPSNAEFRCSCDHHHNESCEQCYELQEVLCTIEDECSSALSSAEDQAGMQHTIKQARVSLAGKPIRYVQSTKLRRSIQF